VQRPCVHAVQLEQLFAITQNSCSTASPKKEKISKGKQKERLRRRLRSHVSLQQSIWETFLRTKKISSIRNRHRNRESERATECSLPAALPDCHLLLFKWIHIQASFAKGNHSCTGKLIKTIINWSLKITIMGYT